ncbi:MAG: hypothetical protein ABIA63_13445 [bacterium]
MSTVWDRVLKNFKQGATVSAEKIEVYAKLGKIKIDIISIKRKMDAVFSELGGCFYSHLLKHPKTEFSDKPEVNNLVQRIKDLESEHNKLEEQLSNLKKSIPSIRFRRADDFIKESNEKNSKEKKS